MENLTYRHKAKARAAGSAAQALVGVVASGNLEVLAEREQAIRGVAGYTEIGRGRDRASVERLRERKVIQRPEDLGVDPLDADRSLLAARSVKDLVHWSGGLYAPPARFRNW